MNRRIKRAAYSSQQIESSENKIKSSPNNDIFIAGIKYSGILCGAIAALCVNNIVVFGDAYYYNEACMSGLIASIILFPSTIVIGVGFTMFIDGIWNIAHERKSWFDYFSIVLGLAAIIITIWPVYESLQYLAEALKYLRLHINDMPH